MDRIVRGIVPKNSLKTNWVEINNYEKFLTSALPAA